MRMMAHAGFGCCKFIRHQIGLGCLICRPPTLKNAKRCRARYFLPACPINENPCLIATAIADLPKATITKINS